MADSAVTLAEEYREAVEAAVKQPLPATVRLLRNDNCRALAWTTPHVGP
jgi:hypothetical protein